MVAAHTVAILVLLIVAATNTSPEPALYGGRCILQAARMENLAKQLGSVIDTFFSKPIHAPERYNREVRLRDDF